jgi:hypothetical protein
MYFQLIDSQVGSILNHQHVLVFLCLLDVFIENLKNLCLIVNIVSKKYIISNLEIFGGAPAPFALSVSCGNSALVSLKNNRSISKKELQIIKIQDEI